ncbi:MAG: ArnT family glycosyltransferase [Flavobacterium sp.]
MSIGWAIPGISFLILLLRNKTTTYESLNLNKHKVVRFYQSLQLKEKIILGVISFFIVLLFIQGLLYPPNNWDSLTYHLSRIMYWIGNESVSHFPTNILRHLYQPPFAEYFILHLNLLNGNDYLSNSVQLFFLIQILFVVYAILGLLNIPRFLKLLALFLVITIPAVELQSTTTKNDIVCAFFMLTAVYFVIKSFQKSPLENYFFLGLAIGLGFLTKGTAYLFLAPVLFCFGISESHKLWTSKNIIILKNCFISALIALFINTGHYSRNYAINQNILSIDNTESEKLSNEAMNSKLLLSNLIKNSGLHLGYPIRESSDSLVRNIHKKIDVSIDDKRLNFLDLPYEGARETTNEDYVPNTLVFFLAIISFLIITIRFFVCRPYNKTALVIVLIIGSQILLFAGFLKWQPWHTRLHIPIFILSVISIIFACQSSKWYKRFVLVCVPILLYSFVFYFLYNNLRPIIHDPQYTKSIRISDSRFKKYFANQPMLYKEYSTILNQIYDTTPRKIGLNLADWEYPLLHSFYYDNLKLVAINVGNCTKKIKQDETNIDLIVSNTNTPFMLLNGVKYSNQNSTHSYIWLYTK